MAIGHVSRVNIAGDKGARRCFTNRRRHVPRRLSKHSEILHQYTVQQQRANHGNRNLLSPPADDARTGGDPRYSLIDRSYLTRIYLSRSISISACSESSTTYDSISLSLSLSLSPSSRIINCPCSSSGPAYITVEKLSPPAVEPHIPFI